MSNDTFRIFVTDFVLALFYEGIRSGIRDFTPHLYIALGKWETLSPRLKEILAEKARGLEMVDATFVTQPRVLFFRGKKPQITINVTQEETIIVCFLSPSLYETFAHYRFSPGQGGMHLPLVAQPDTDGTPFVADTDETQVEII